MTKHTSWSEEKKKEFDRKFVLTEGGWEDSENLMFLDDKPLGMTIRNDGKEIDRWWPFLKEEVWKFIEQALSTQNKQMKSWEEGYCETCRKLIGKPGKIYIAGSICDGGHARVLSWKEKLAEVGFTQPPLIKFIENLLSTQKKQIIKYLEEMKKDTSIRVEDNGTLVENIKYNNVISETIKYIDSL